MAKQTRIVEENGEKIYEIFARKDKPHRVNLTKLYGRGKEPTKEKLDNWNKKAELIGKSPGKKTYPNMTRAHGIRRGERCGDCKWFEIWDYRDKTYFKCTKRGTSHSTASDIRKKDQACGLFERERSEKF